MTENEAYKFIGQAVIESGKALEALQSIKSEAERVGRIGEYYANLDNCVKEIEACRAAMKALEEIQQYRAIGTIEEFKALKEKSVAKKPIDKIMYFECPACGDVGILDCGYCSVCGQKLDWRE